MTSKLAFFHNLSLDNLNYPQDQVGIAAIFLKIYANSKLCSIIAASELSKKLNGTDVTAYAVHPGVVYTQIYSRSGKGHSLATITFRLFNKIITESLSRVSWLLLKKTKELISIYITVSRRRYTNSSACRFVQRNCKGLR